MEFTCHGCLNNVPRSRRTKTDPESIKCYRSILEEQTVNSLFSDTNVLVDLTEISLCWECNTLIHKFAKFKRKLQYSYKVFQQVTQSNSTHNSKPLSSSYQKILLHNINYNPDQTHSEGFEIITNSNKYIIKTEIIKEESDVDHLDIEENNLFSEPIDKLDTDNIEGTINKLDTNKGEEKNLNKLLAETKEKTKKVSNHKKIIKKVKQKNVKLEEKVVDSIEVCFKQVELNEKEVEEERSMLCKDSSYVNALYKCDSCIESFPNSDDMKDHFDNKHNDNHKRKCPTCQCTFSSTLSYTYHVNRHTVRFECTRCMRRFSTKSKVVRHFEEYHVGVMGFACALCQVKFSTEIELCLHKRTQQHTTAASLETPPPPVAAMHCCTLCDKTFKWRTSLNKHLDKHRIASGLKRQPFCEICSLTFTHSASLTKHVKTSWKHQMLLQERNAKEGRSIDSARERETKFPCPLCDKRFQWKGNLQRHVSSHAARAAGELVCIPCDRSFSSIATYRQHMKISRKHVSEEDFQYKCSECLAKFVSKSKLRDHIDWEHLKNYTHSCDTCKKVFKSHTSLYLHQNTVHVKEGTNHLCDHCGKSFPHVGKLRSHISAVHSEQAPYKCRICATTFSWHSCLSRHLKLVHKQAVGALQTSEVTRK